MDAAEQQLDVICTTTKKAVVDFPERPLHRKDRLYAYGVVHPLLEWAKSPTPLPAVITPASAAEQADDDDGADDDEPEDYEDYDLDDDAASDDDDDV